MERIVINEYTTPRYPVSGRPKLNSVYLRELNNDLKRWSIEEIKRFVIHNSGEHLPDEIYHEDTLRDERGVPFIQSVCGSALSILGIPGKVGSQEVLDKAAMIIAHITNYGFTVYSKREALMVYAYLRIIEENKNIN